LHPGCVRCAADGLRRALSVWFHLYAIVYTVESGLEGAGEAIELVGVLGRW
jgi:hypothetical protein